jgi:riboflavin kinase
MGCEADDDKRGDAEGEEPMIVENTATSGTSAGRRGGSASTNSSSSSSSGSSSYLSRIRRGGHFHGTPHVLLRVSAEVVRGFGRGSKLLGIPTANMSMQDIGAAVDELPTGIYQGFAELEGVEGMEGVFKSVISIGWNPYFSNKKKTVEPHLLHDFGDLDFYGATLHLCLSGYVRPEMNFSCLDDLITAIKADIDYAKAELDVPPHRDLSSRVRG